jgi:peptide/nickel transport system substrate-binding protein
MDSADPTATIAAVPSPVTREEEAVEAPDPTPERDVPAPTAVPDAAPFVVNGVTMPFKRSETLVMDQVNFAIFDSFNPFVANGVEFAAGWWQIAQEYLWYVNYATGEVIPWLAESHAYSEDYKTLTIYIRKGVTWNDGVPFTAHDVAFTMNMLMADETLYGPGDMQYWDEVYAADDYTVVFKMNEPRPRQHLLFWCTICTGQQIIPKHIWEGVDPHTFKNNPPVTTGPYIFERAYPEQEVMVWKRNADYWGIARGYVPAPQYVVYRTRPDEEQHLVEIQDNHTDIFRISYELYRERRDDLAHLNVVAYVDPCPRAVFFNTAKPHLDQPAFRRALSMLMNRPKWAESFWVPPSKPAEAFWADYRNLDKFINREANEKWGILAYDPERAMRIFKELGYMQDGHTLVDAQGEAVTFEISTPAAPGSWEYQMAQDYVEALKAVGIEAHLHYYEQPVMFSNTRNGTFEIGFWWMCGATVDPLELFNHFTCDRAVPIGEEAKRGNDMRLCDPDLDAVLAELNAQEPEAPGAHALYMEAYDHFMRDAPGVPLIQTYYTAYFNTTYWHNMVSDDNLYTVPFNWWGQIMFVLFNIEPAE